MNHPCPNMPSAECMHMFTTASGNEAQILRLLRCGHTVVVKPHANRDWWVNRYEYYGSDYEDD